MEPALERALGIHGKTKRKAVPPARPLKIRLLGELQIAYGDDAPLKLPASKKTRALLGYLIATAQPHRRERLCDLFWDGPDDPRAELRWSLSKIRPLLRDGAELVADRERVGVSLDAPVDLALVRSLVGGGIASASTENLKQAASLLVGEFLDGLDLPACYRFQEWCMAEREAVSQLRLGVLTALVGKLDDQPGDALPYARNLTIADPFSEPGHAAVVRLLSRLGREQDALAHYQRARRVFEKELGAPPSEELEKAHVELQRLARARPAAEPAAAKSQTRPQSSAAAIPAVGRKAERAALEAVIGATTGQRKSQLVLVTGEAGIGKSHLLDEVGARMVAAGGSAWSARAFEAEAARPYGVWFDILRAIVRARPRGELPADLRMLLPNAGTDTSGGDRGRLFGAVVDLLRTITAQGPAAIILDDIQWIDEASSALLHYVARHLDSTPGLLIICAAREGEIEDNTAAASVLRSLTGKMTRIELAPLGRDDTISLVRSIDPKLDGAGIHAASEGNPLFTLELARAHSRGEAEPGPTISALIAGQLARMSEPAQEVLVWAAAYGRPFRPDELARAGTLDEMALISTFGELERRGLLRLVGDNGYDFSHDLVRQNAYRSISQPRRKLLHRHFARVLNAAMSDDPAIAGDAVYHAALADDHQTAARACVVAGERALRLFANVDAANFAERGLHHVERLPSGVEPLEMRIALLKIRILAAAGPGMRPLPPLTAAVAQAARRAEELGLPAAAATAHYLLSVLHQEAGNTDQAQHSTLRAAAAGRAADETTRAQQLANTARCLLELETEIDRSRELIREGSAIADPLGLELCELHWARGLLQRWDGEAASAISSLSKALALARDAEDRWREYKCLTWLAVLEQEQGDHAAVRARCAELKIVAGRLGEDETPFVATLQALALLAADEASAASAMADALHCLRSVDDKSYLAYALNNAARIHLRAGRIDQARLYASEALAAASAMRRQNEMTIAQAMLARAGEAPLVLPDTDWPTLSARARATLLDSRN